MTKKIQDRDINGILISIYFIDMVLESSTYCDIRFCDIALSCVRIMVLAISMVLALTQLQRYKRERIIIIMLFVMLSLANLFFSEGGYRFLIMILLVINSRKMSIDYIYKLAFKWLSLSSLFVIISSLIGIIPDNINYRVISDEAVNILAGEYTRHSYGFLMSNIIPFTLVYLYLYRIVMKKNRMRFFEHVIFQIMNICIFYACGSRVVFLVMVMIALLQVCCRVKDKIFPSRSKAIRFLTCIFPGITMICFVFTFVFGREVENPVNKLFNFRLSNNFNAIDCYGLHLIGNESNVGTVDSLNGVVVDNGYTLLFLQKGLIVGTIVIGIWTWITYKATKNYDLYILTTVIALAILNFVDYHFISFMNIPFYCLLVHEKVGFNTAIQSRRFCKRGYINYENRDSNIELQKL